MQLVYCASNVPLPIPKNDIHRGGTEELRVFGFTYVDMDIFFIPTGIHFSDGYPSTTRSAQALQ